MNPPAGSTARLIHWLMLGVSLTLTLETASAAAETSTPENLLPGSVDFKQVLSLDGAGSPRVSPDGSSVIYPVRSADWEDNRYDTELWMVREGGTPFQLTRSRETSSTSPEWSPDGTAITFLSDRGDGRQIQWIRPDGGEPLQLTAVEDGVDGFEWSPDGAFLAIAITEPGDGDREKQQEAYGDFAIEDSEYRMTHLWMLDVAAALEAGGDATLPAEEDGDEDGEVEEAEPSPFRRLTEGDDFTVGSFRWAPDGSAIAFDHSPNPSVESFEHADISIVEVSTGETRSLLALEGYESNPIWSPDGHSILFHTAGDGNPYYANTELARIPVEGGDIEILTKGFDEDASAVAWLDEGIVFLARERTHRKLFRLDPAGGTHELLTDSPRIVRAVDFSQDGSVVAFSADSPDTLVEIYRATGPEFRPQRLTTLTGQTAEWSTGTREVVAWKSRDGAMIEGVVLKPDDFDPTQKHPLLVIIHGGPTGTSVPNLVYGYVYPVQQWLAKGAVVLMPNYRGSAGYGAEFRELNVRNLGVGDAWDVLSGVDHLAAEGFIDEERMGAMGWSQGGYISAFLTTTSDRFSAISVGAGISNWMTYYVNTDIHPFTRHYLEATPWSDPEIYALTSPMTHINQATTPTLIQHGEFDRRVPTPNAYELFQGLEDVGAETKLIIYKGFGHGITKPKERLAAVWHNWQWFAATFGTKKWTYRSTRPALKGSGLWTH